MSQRLSRRQMLVASAVAVNAVTAMPSALAQSAKKSFITLKIYSVTGVESYFSLKWTSLTLIETTTRKTITLTDNHPFSTHSHFAGEIESGTYAIHDLSVPGPSIATFGFIGGAILAAINTTTGSLGVNEFRLEAKPGEICNGGAIGFAWVFDDPKLKNGRVIAIPFPKDIGNALALDGFDEARLKQLTNLGIEVPQAKLDFNTFPEALEPLVKVATIYGANTLLANGDVLQAGTLGWVFKRSASDGKWSRHWCGQFDRISMLKQLADGVIVGAASTGSLVEWTNLDARPSVKRFDIGNRSLMQIESMGQKAYALLFRVPSAGPALTMLPFSKVSLFVASALEPVTKLTRVTDIDPAAVSFGYPTLWDGETLKIYQARVGLSRTSGVFTLDPATSKVVETSLPTWVVKISNRPTGHRMIRENGSTRYLGFSKDQGKTWDMSDKTMPNSLTDAISAAASDAGTEYMIGMKTLRTGWSANEVALITSKDGGQTWRDAKTPLTSFKGGFLELIFASDKEWIVKTSFQGLLRSEDDGGSWMPWVPPA